MIVELRIVDKLVDSKGKIYGYTIEDINKKQMNVYADELKANIRKGLCTVENYTLTSDNRLLHRKIKDVTKYYQLNTDKLIPSIFGIQVKGVKTKQGREGEYYCGNVYYNGKKLGFWSQDPYGCIADNFEFDTRQLDEALNKYREYKKYDRSLESMLLDVVILSEYYKEYTKMIKTSRYKILTVVTDKFDYSVYSIHHNGMSEVVQDSINKASKKIVNNNLGLVIKHFKSENDFIIR